jgi:hypothetical protein
MKEKVAVATVQGKAYFMIVNMLRENNIPFISLLPDQLVPPKVKLVITTEQEKALVNHDKVLVFEGENQLDILIDEVKKALLGKTAYEKIVAGIDPGEAIGLAILADGKVIEESNCYNNREVINTILKTVRNVNYSLTSVTVKIGNGVPVYKELLEDMDTSLPIEIALEVVSEKGTNKPLKENRRSRGVRHISSAKSIAGRTGRIIQRRKTIAANSGTQ